MTNRDCQKIILYEFLGKSAGGIFCLILAFLTISPAKSYSYINAQPEFNISEEDIKNAIPTQAPVVFDNKIRHDVEVMEKRHFEKTNDFDSPKYRVAKLENYLLGRTYEFSLINDRMERLKLASQRKALSGTSIPPGLRKHFSPARIANNSTPVYDNEDNVGLIDGLLKLYAPQIYYPWSKRKKRLQECYNDG